jgi:hypothetical protein
MAAVEDVLESAELGMVLSAPTRYGKSTFIDELELRMQRRRVGVVLRSTMIPGRVKDNKFYRRLRGEEEGVESLFPMQSPLLALLRHIENECDKVSSKLVMLALDEAQNLEIDQLDWLKALTENLLNMGYKPFALLVGQPEILLLRELLRDCSRQDIVQRFMLRSHALRGLRSAAEVRPLLRDADSAVWPPGSGQSHTQFFAPDAWRSGWRLENETEGLWQAFRHHAQAIGLNPDKLDVGAQFVAQAKLAVLQGTVGALDGERERLLVDPRRPLPPSHPVLARAVVASGFHESQNLGAKPVDPSSPVSKQARRWRATLRQRE